MFPASQEYQTHDPTVSGKPGSPGSACFGGRGKMKDLCPGSDGYSGNLVLSPPPPLPILFEDALSKASRTRRCTCSVVSFHRKGGIHKNLGSHMSAVVHTNLLLELKHYIFCILSCPLDCGPRGTLFNSECLPPQPLSPALAPYFTCFRGSMYLLAARVACGVPQVIPQKGKTLG